MGEDNKDFVNKDICEEKHKAVDNRFLDLKANIHTSKESLSNRLDEVDTALLGDRRAPGGLLRDFIDIKKEFETHKEEVNKEFEHYQENIEKDMKIMGWKIWIAVGLSILAVGGKFLGISISSVKGLFSDEPTPVVTIAPAIEDDDNVPIAIKELIRGEIQ